MIKTIEKYPLLSLAVLVFLMLLIHLDVPNISIMEARNFITSREMIQDNHWMLPTMNGEPRYQKPPLPTWLTAISGLLFGVNSLIALRLPAALMVLFLGIFSYYFSLKLKLTKSHSFRNSLILLTSFYVIGILFEAPWDIFAHSFMFAGIYYLFTFFEEHTSEWKNVLLAAFFFGLSLLSKGPVSLFSMFLPFLISYGIVFKFKNSKQKWLPLLSFTLLFMSIGTSWFIYTHFADPETFLAIASKETGNWSSYNLKPFYYYWNFFIQSGLWTIPAIIGLLYPYIIKRVENKKAYKFTFWWTIIAVILLSTIPEKKARYLMPVLIPLALNTGFYIQYLIGNFSKLTNKKETIPVYFNFGLIALIAIGIPIVIYISFQENITSILSAFVLTSISSIGLGIYLFWKLKQKKAIQLFYATVIFIPLLLLFGTPIFKALQNDTPNKISAIKTLEKELSIKTYTIREITVLSIEDKNYNSPEFLWYYQGCLKNIYKNETLKLPKEESFGILITPPDIPKILNLLEPNYHIKLIESYNLNTGKKQKNRLIRTFYLISKK